MARRGRRMTSYCSNCIHYKVCGNEGVDDVAMTFCSDKQTDGDLISRKEAEKCCLDGWNKDYKDILEDIRKLPSAEKTAEWIKQKSGDELFPEEIVCSKCYHSNSHLDFDEHNNPIGKLFLKSKYCPNCGAKMKKSGEEE